MALRFYMDVHIPSAVTEGLRRRGIDVLTSQEDGTSEKDDESLLQRAAELDRLLYTQDQDFLQITRQWQNKGLVFPGLFFSHQEGISIGRSIEDLELVALCCSNDEVTNQVIYLPLK